MSQRRRRARGGSPASGSPASGTGEAARKVPDGPKPAQAAPSARPASSGSASPEALEAQERAAQQRVALAGFAVLGLLMGFLTGANSQPEVASSSSPLVQAAQVAVSLATQRADWPLALSGGLLGGVVGASFGYSLFLSPAVMGICLLAGSLGLGLGLGVTGVVLMGGIGWASGFLAALFGALRLRPGAGS